MKVKNLRVWDGAKWASANARAWKESRWVAATDGGLTEIPSPTAAYPPALDNLQALLRPELPAVATLYVGRGKQYATLTEAIAAVDSKRSGPPAPHNRVDIIVSPGVYVENLKPPTHIGIIGATGSPDDVVIQGINAQPSFVGVLYTRGSLYMEGVTVYQPPGVEGVSQFNPKYPIHHDHHGTLVMSHCKLTAMNRFSGGGGTCLGVDGGDAGMIFAYKTVFEGITGASTNSHGPNTNDTAPITNIYVDCTMSSSTGYNALDTSSGTLYLMGATTCQGVTTKGPNVTLVLDPAATVGPVTASGLVEYGTSYPEVRGAMSPYERRKFYGG